MASLFPLKDSSRLIKVTRYNEYIPAYSPYGLIAYTKMRIIDFNVVNYVLVGLISF